MRVRTNKREYSRYDDDPIVVATIDNIDPAQPLVVALVRRDGYGDVVRRVFATPQTTETITLPLGVYTGSDDGERSAVIDGLNYATHGAYVVEARQGNTTARRAVRVSVLPQEEWRRSYLFGIPLYAEDVLQPVQQPQTLTGITITYVDPGMLKGQHVLALTTSPRSLSWSGGASVRVIGDDPITLRLLNRENDAYIEVEIEPLDLPTSQGTETILIDTWRLTDADLYRYIDDAYHATARALQLRLETSIVTTDPVDGVYYDVIAAPEPSEPGVLRAVQIGNPNARPVRHVSRLSGQYGSQQVLNLPPEWFSVQGMTNIIELVPVAGGAAWNLAGLSPTWALVQQRQGTRSVPGFWHYDLVAGLDTLDGDRFQIREIIAKTAAVRVLLDLSLATTGGRTSKSAQREGVSDSANYGSGGAYGEKIQAYQQWLDTTIKRARKYFNGANMIVM